MKLLFDENLSPRLAERLQDIFPGSSHVDTLGLGNTPDDRVWAAARDGGLAIVTKDADFQDIATLPESTSISTDSVWFDFGKTSESDSKRLQQGWTH